MANDVSFQTATLATPANNTKVSAFQLGTSSAYAQVISLGGESNSAVAVSASDTVVKAAAGLLARVLITVVGTADLQIYDNASAGSGTVVGFIAGNTPAGYIADIHAPCANGITVKGNAANPAVTVFYA